MPVTNWICIKCGVTNPKTYFKCQTCQEPKPIFWECTSCKVRNPTVNLKCTGCRRKRPALFSNAVNMKGLSKAKFSCEVSRSTADLNKENSASSSNSATLPSSISSYIPTGTGSGIAPSSVSSAFATPSTKSAIDNVSSYDIFRKLSRPSRTVKQLNYTDDDSKYKQILTNTQNSQYTDNSFPPSSKSLYFNSDTYRKQVVANKALRVHWLRHKDIRSIDTLNQKPPDPHAPPPPVLPWVVIRDPVSSDITQGVLGNCWFLSALAVLVEKPAWLDRILAIKEINNQGVYRIRLFKDGKLTSVIIDDLFPCNNKRFLIYSCAKRKQLFVPIIEKGMAKLYGCYESLVSGQTTEGLSALTGYPCRAIKIQNTVTPDSAQSSIGEDETTLDPDFIWTLLMSYHSAGFLMGAACGCNTDSTIDAEEYKDKGLLMRHAYSIINVTTVNNEKLLRLRNPWGQKVWTGDWSDESPLWTPELREELQPNCSSEGIFWISFTDFQRYFEKVDVCKLREGWNEARYEGYFPYSANDNRYMCVFEVAVEEPSTEIEFTLHQESRRSLALHNFPLLPICAAVFQLKDLQRNIAGDLIDFSGYKIREFVGCDVMVDKGLYLVAIYAFNHWNSAVADTIQTGRNLRPRFIMSAHSSRYVTINAYCPSPTIIGDTLIELTLSKGRKKQHNENVMSYYMHENWAGLLVVIENRNSDTFLEVIFDASESINLSTTRGNLLTQDTIPPMSRQLVNILSHVDTATAYYLSYQMSYRISNQSSTNHNPEISLLQALHSPRVFKQIRE